MLPSENLTAKYASLNKFIDEKYVESYDGREVALLNYVYNHCALDKIRGSPSAMHQTRRETQKNLRLLSLEFDPLTASVAIDLIDLELHSTANMSARQDAKLGY
ncbi:hypothetical protein PENVUL_c018G04167 [Penicillium vulpinum]|uniref:Uncharacterized protein n=1 Tax=Penicillium vulpinum TaxID=29845 RepID=A0A1V6RY61_9EURO|nr:hypothetical protein PENVUL_c018G04167 [Penicillium vulpinum]